MGCSASMVAVDNTEAIVMKKTKFLAGKFQRVEVAKGIWIIRMKQFITNLTNQIQEYGEDDIKSMYGKLCEYQRNLYVLSDTNSKHAKAVAVVADIFDSIPFPKPKRLRDDLVVMAAEYWLDSKEHDFEEIMFVFSIIVNTPIINFLEPKY